MSLIVKGIERRWQQEGVKYKHIGMGLKWYKALRTADCVFCKEHQVETEIDAGFLNWSLLIHEFNAEGKLPEVCPKCIKKISRDLIPAPRFAECPTCHCRQREKIYGTGWPGWKQLVSTGRTQEKEMIRNLACPNCVLILARKLGSKFIRDTWTALTYAAGSLLTSTKMTQNQGNFTAVAEGHTNAPILSGEIQTAKGNLIKKIAADDNTYTLVDDNCKVWRAVYNDLAELMPCSEETEPGDVLIWNEGKVKRSQTSNDKRVIGVHSDTYGFCLGGENSKSIEKAIKKGFVPVAIAGRVKIIAVGPTGVGDLLMSSNFPGIAMRGNPLGAVVAKALEKLYPGEKKRIDSILTLR